MKSALYLQLGHHRYYPQPQKLLSDDGGELSLRPQSLRVLQLLAEHAGEVVSKDEIFAAVWRDVVVSDDSLVQCIGDIRRALGDSKHKILKTVPRRGYKLVAEQRREVTPQPESGLSAAGGGERWLTLTRQHVSRYPAVAAVLSMLFLTLIVWLWPSSGPEFVAAAYKKEPAPAGDSYASTLSVQPASAASADNTVVSDALKALLQELQVALGRYRSVKLVDDDSAEYRLLVDEHHLGDKSSAQMTLQLKYVPESATVFAESYELDAQDNAVQKVAIRAAAAVASPGVGAIGRHLLASSRLKPVEELTPAECYSYGYGCTKCSGEEDNVDWRAKACLANLLEKNPKDAKGWALQAGLYTHQYLFGSTLSEPERSNLKLRQHLPGKAIEAANKAEALSDGTDSSIYWGMAQAYYASCQVDKMQAAIERGLEINPDDPNLLAVFGNWLSYTGRWKEGGRLTRRALEIEPQKHKKWWWMGLAKAHYARGENELAYQTFLTSFNERNWLSHLQMAYTLPYLGRVEEAQAALRELQRHSPGFTVEKALEFYKVFCFGDEFLDKMKQALLYAGLPSRGDSGNYDDIRLPTAKTLSVNGTNVEYMDVGQGEPVLFVHGTVSDYRTWGHYFLPVSEKHRYISYSRRYFGTQPWPDNGEQWSSDTFVADLIGFIEALDIGPVHLVSWSSGGIVTNLAAVQRPDLIKSSIHYEPVANSIMTGNEADESLQQDWFRKWDKWQQFIDQGDTEGAAAELINVVFELPEGGFQDETEITKELVLDNAENLLLGSTGKGSIQIDCQYLQGIRAPTLIVYGAKTNPYWTRMSQKFGECTPGAKLVVMDGTNHKGPIEKVSEFSSLILDFVDQHQ
ncbi:MAG: alpha/beta fold hydrolase [Thiolinea sp.]